MTPGMTGFHPSKSCNTWLSISNLIWALSAARRVTCDRNTDFAGTDKTSIGLDADDGTLFKTEVFNLAVLNDVDTN